MRLRNQLLVIFVAATCAVMVPVAALFELARGVGKVQAASQEAQTELAAKLERLSQTESYFRAEIDRIEDAESTPNSAASRAQVLATYDGISKLIGTEHGELQRAEAKHEAGLRTKFVELADGLAALRAHDARQADELDRRFDTELLPSLFQSAGHESALLAESLLELERRSTQAAWAAGLSLLLGVAILLVLVQRIARSTERSLRELLIATRTLASGDLRARAAPLPTMEFDEIGRAFNSMAGDLGDAADARVRVEKLAAVGQLAASVGHEIRNPLSAARNALSYLRRKAAKDAAPAAGDRSVEFIELADRELEACNRIVQELLDFARERPLNLTSTALQTLVDEVLEVVRSRPDVELKNEVPEELPPIDADRDQLRQVLLNLVQNGIEAIPVERSGNVSVQAHVDHDWFRIRVSDDGSGIPEGDRKRIFEPLVTTKTKGTGLGLAITAAIVKRHRGTLELETAANQGTSFQINLPLLGENTAP
jgi:signal transduction histidine kinase